MQVSCSQHLELLIVNCLRLHRKKSGLLMRSSHIFEEETEMLRHPTALSLEEEEDESDFEKGLVMKP